MLVKDRGGELDVEVDLDEEVAGYLTRVEAPRDAQPSAIRERSACIARWKWMHYGTGIHASC